MYYPKEILQVDAKLKKKMNARYVNQYLTLFVVLVVNYLLWYLVRRLKIVAFKKRFGVEARCD
jgi:sugar phosphate permease